MNTTIMALSSLFIGCLGAQTDQAYRQPYPDETIRTVDMGGTLVDQGCYSTHTRRTETTTNPDNSTTTTVTTHVVTQCPVTTSTTSFGFITPEGRYVRFDNAGNTRVVEMVRSNRDWDGLIREHKPVRVRIVGIANGDVVLIKEIR